MNSKRKCPICAHSDVLLLHYQKFQLLNGCPLPDSYNVVSCERCGMVYADVDAGQEAYSAYYENFSKYTSETLGAGGYASDCEKKRFQFLVERIKDVASPQDSIVDIGCAKGGFLCAFRDAGFDNLTGVDPSADCVRIVASAGIKAVRGGVPGLSNATMYKVILFANTLEHVYDLHGAVKNLSEICEENGLLYVEVPDAASYADFPQVPYYYFDIEHINHFDENALQNLMRVYGFTSKSLFRYQIDVNTKKYPMLGVIFQKTANLPGSLVNSTRLTESIRHYLSGANFERINSILAPYIGSGPIIVWGAGQFAARLLAATRLAECEIAYFVDKDAGKVGRNINGKSIKLPSEIMENFPIILCSALFTDDMLKEISEMGLSNVVVPLA